MSDANCQNVDENYVDEEDTFIFRQKICLKNKAWFICASYGPNKKYATMRLFCGFQQPHSEHLKR